MKIDDLIQELEQVKEEHGNLVVSKLWDGIYTDLAIYTTSVKEPSKDQNGNITGYDMRDRSIKEETDYREKFLVL